MAQVKNIFNFLKDYNELSNPVVTEISKQKWHYKLSNVPDIKEVWSIYNVQDFEEHKILEVKRPDLRPCPSPDEILRGWVDDDWSKLSLETVTYRETHVKEVKDTEGTITQEVIRFDDDEDRVISFENWAHRRENWRKAELPKKAGLDLYNALYNLYSDIKKEAESVELILGDGHIRWYAGERVINHPVLLQKVHLTFNPYIPAFTISCEELKTELYTPMLRIIPSINQAMLPDVINEIEDHGFHIADKSNITGFFQRLINVIDQKGKCVEAFEIGYDGPMIMHDPMLFLRKRNLGYAEFLDKIIEDIGNNGDMEFPDFLQNMAGNYRDEKPVELLEDNWNENGIDQEVLLTLPANNEQLRTIKHLDSYGAVLVQGPPGTGKTHTIANLIGHLLSEGKSVLVTSHTEKALTVLKEKVHKDLQNLCISLLSSSSQRKEMDTALFEIAEKSTSVDLRASKREIESLEQQRRDLVKEYRERRQELIQIRSLDYKDIVFANETLSPIDAAKFVNKGKGKYDYIPGISLDDTVSLPLSREELHYLYQSSEMISVEEEEILSNDLPCLYELWSGKDFSAKVHTFLELEATLKGWVPKFRIKDEIDEQKLLELISEAEGLEDDLNKLEDFQCAMLDKVIKDKVYRSFWEEVFEGFDELMTGYEAYRKLLFDNNYSIPEGLIHEDTIATLDEIIETGKEVPVNLISGLMRPKWKKVKDTILNDNKSIEKKGDYLNAKAIISHELKRKVLESKIEKLLLAISQPIDFGTGDIEGKMENTLRRAKTALNWHEEKWISYTSKVRDNIEEPTTFDELCQLDKETPVESITYLLGEIFILDLRQQHALMLFRRVNSELDVYRGFLEDYRMHPFFELCNSVEKKDLRKYENHYEEIRNLYLKRKTYEKRKGLLERLAKVAPDWAKSIKQREGIHGGPTLPNDIELAWRWSQLDQQINRINSYDPHHIQKEITRINEALMQNARKLAYESAWYYKIKNNTPQQTQAIEGWRQTMRQVGRGTGRNAPRLLRRARELMPRCQMAIPVWIMSLNRVAENLIPKEISLMWSSSTKLAKPIYWHYPHYTLERRSSSSVTMSR